MIYVINISISLLKMHHFWSCYCRREYTQFNEWFPSYKQKKGGVFLELRFSLKSNIRISVPAALETIGWNITGNIEYSSWSSIWIWLIRTWRTALLTDHAYSIHNPSRTCRWTSIRWPSWSMISPRFPLNETYWITDWSKCDY